jgi:hypothetical protein
MKEAHMKRIVCIITFLCLSPLARAQEFRYPVKHEHLIRGCEGELILGPDGVEFAAKDKKHSRAWKYIEIQQIGLLSPTQVSILTYEDNRWELGKDRIFRFAILRGEITASVWGILQTRVAQPLVAAVFPTGIPSRYQIPVKHLRGFGGSEGMLEFSDEYIVYKTDAKEDSRIWRYEDISSVGTTGPYQLRLTSMDRVQGEFGGDRNFVFQLKRRLDEQAYDFIWWKINGPGISGVRRAPQRLDSSDTTGLVPRLISPQVFYDPDFHSPPHRGAKHRAAGTAH